MNRRMFVTFVGGAAIWPLAARAQQISVPVIGYLSSGSPKGFGTRLTAFRQGLHQTGYREGQSVAIEYRWAEGRNDRLPELAADLVDNGITMAGGSSLLRGLTTVISNATGLDTRLAEDPLTCVARGTSVYLENLELWKDTMESDLDDN